MRDKIPLALASGLFFAIALLARTNYSHIGRTPSPAEIKQWDITVLPNGVGLPAGSGTPAQGEALYRAQCAVCHGAKGEGNAALGPALVGGVGSLATPKPLKTVGSYWPYATTVWDYIHRSMPYDRPGALTADETYAVTAFLLFRNGIIPRDQVMDRESLPKVRMPNRDGFIPDNRPDVGKNAHPPQTVR
ncbi:MAG: c-type cytochrome [Candidatus Acidiferrales bacterium]